MTGMDWLHGVVIGLIAWWASWRFMQNDLTARGAIYAIALLLIGTSTTNLLEHGFHVPSIAVGLLGFILLIFAVSWPKFANSSLANSIRTVTASAWFWIAVVAFVWIYGTASSLVLLAQRNALETIVKEDIVPIRTALERWVIPRNLSEEQKQTIANYLSKFRSYKAAFTVPARDAEAVSYQNDIKEALVEGGWKISGGRTELDDVEEGLTYDFIQTPETFHRDDNDPRNPKQNKLFSDALAKAKVDVIGGANHQTKAGEEEILIIHIGHRKRDRKASLEFWPY